MVFGDPACTLPALLCGEKKQLVTMCVSAVGGVTSLSALFPNQQYWNQQWQGPQWEGQWLVQI